MRIVKRVTGVIRFCCPAVLMSGTVNAKLPRGGKSRRPFVLFGNGHRGINNSMRRAQCLWSEKNHWKETCILHPRTLYYVKSNRTQMTRHAVTDIWSSWLRNTMWIFHVLYQDNLLIIDSSFTCCLQKQTLQTTLQFSSVLLHGQSNVYTVVEFNRSYFRLSVSRYLMSHISIWHRCPNEMRCRELSNYEKFCA